MPVRGLIRDTAVVAAVLVVAIATIIGSIGAAREMPVLVGLPLLLPLAAVAGYVGVNACRGERTSLLAFFIILAFVNDGLFRVRDPGEIGLDWQNALKLGLWAGALVIGVCRLPRSWPLLGRGPFIWVLIYDGYALLSSIYSEAPMYSFGTAIGLLAMTVLGPALITEVGPRPVLLGFALSLLLFILLGWVAYYAVPELGRSLFITADGSIVERICGLAGQANALGNVLAVYLAVVFLLWYFGHVSAWWCIPLALVGLFTLLVADSRTALGGFIVGVTAVTLRRSVWLWSVAMVGGAVVALSALSVPLRELMQLSGGLSRSGDPTELFTLTGRTEIWQFVWEHIVLNPWFGYGYNSSKFILPQFDGLPGLKIDEAHNMLLQNLLAVGIVGTVPLVGFLLHSLVKFVTDPHVGRDMLVFMTLIWGITVAGPFGSTPTVLTMLIAVVLAMSNRDRLASPAVRPNRAQQLYPVLNSDLMVLKP